MKPRQNKTLNDMNVKSVLLLLLFLSLKFTAIMGQTTKGCIISIENGMVNVDLTSAQVQAGDCLDVIVNGGYMTNPVTGRRIKKKDQVLGILEVGATYAEYSVAKPQNVSLLSRLKAGMTVRISVRDVSHSFQQNKTSQSDSPVSRNEIMVSSFVSGGELIENSEFSETSNLSESRGDLSKVNIVIAPAQVNDVVHNGHFGGYVADILMEQMLLCDKVRLLDRSVMNSQIDEINLAGDMLDPATTIKRGKGFGARYILQTTMQKPDVANVRTGIPLASVMGAVQGLTGINIGAAYGSNMNFATLKASVSLSVRVVDLQTGEVVFMCSGSGKAKGKAQLSLEYGALGGGELNGGAEDFKQTVTGKAIQQAFMKIGRNLKDFFNGKTDRKVLGSVSGGISYGDKMYAKGYKLYLGTEKLDKDGARAAFTDRADMFFQYQKAKRKKGLSWFMAVGGLAVGVGIASLSVDGGESLPYVISGTIGISSIAGGIILNISGRRKLKRIATSYNNNIQYSYSKSFDSRYSLSLTSTGLRLTF